MRVYLLHVFPCQVRHVDETHPETIIREQEELPGVLPRFRVQGPRFYLFQVLFRQVPFIRLLFKAVDLETSFTKRVSVLRGLVILYRFIQYRPQRLEVILSRVTDAPPFLQEHVKTFHVLYIDLAKNPVFQLFIEQFQHVRQLRVTVRVARVSRVLQNLHVTVQVLQDFTPLGVPLETFLELVQRPVYTILVKLPLDIAHPRLVTG